MQFTLATCLTSFAALSLAYTTPNYDAPPSGNSIYTPSLGDPMTAGQSYTITWGPTTPGPVDLVLLRGPSTNVIPISTIAEDIANTGSYVFQVPTSLEPDTTGYGILLVDATGAYQYSTQFGVKNKANSGTTASSSSHVPGGSASASASSLITHTSTTTSAHESVDSSAYHTSSLTTADHVAPSSASLSHVTYAPGHSDAASNSSVLTLTSTTSRSTLVALQSTLAYNTTGITSTPTTPSIPQFTGGASNNVALNVAAVIVAGAAAVLAF